MFQTRFRATDDEEAALRSCADYTGLSMNETLKVGLKLLTLEVGLHALEAHDFEDAERRIEDARRLRASFLEQVLDRPDARAEVARRIAAMN